MNLLFEVTLFKPAFLFWLELDKIDHKLRRSFMSKIFSRTFRVRWGELDASGSVSPANYLRYLVETAWDWGAAIGWDVNYSQNPDVFWVIRETEIRFQRPLRHNDVFDFTIWMVNWQRVRGATDSLPVDHPDREVENIVMPQGTLETDLGFADHPEHIRVLTIVYIPANGSTPIPGGFHEITQIIRRADRPAGIQLPPSHTECTTKDFGHETPPKLVVDFIQFQPEKKRRFEKCDLKKQVHAAVHCGASH